MITATTTKGLVSAADLVLLAVRLADLAPSGVTLEWGGERLAVEPPEGDSTKAWLSALAEALVGEEVETGDIAQDYDHGTVFERDGGLWVSWQLSQQATRASLGTLRPFDSKRFEQAREALAAEL